MRLKDKNVVRGLFGAFAAAALLWPLACADDEPANVSGWSVYRDADVGAENIRDIAATAGDDVWAVGARGVILRYDGLTWRRTGNGLTTLDLNAVALLSPGEGWAVGQAGAALRLVDGQWYVTYLPTGRDLWSIAYGTDGVAFAVGAGGVIYRWDGSTWTDASLANVNADLKGVTYAGDGVFWAVGDGGTVLQYDGERWSRKAVPTTERLNCVAVREGRTYAGGDHGVILEYANGAWRSMSTPTIREIKAVAFTPAGLGFAAGNDGTLLGLKDGSWGAIAVDFAPHFPDNLNALALLNGGEGWAVGDNALILQYRRPW